MIRVFSSVLRQSAVRRFSSATAASSGAFSPPQQQQTVSKEAMVKLRKLTGYSFVNCRKAIVKYGEANLSDAEKWLHETAKKEGWAKAEKVSGRQTQQGLYGFLSDGNLAAIVELNCETDFVARSEDFKKLVETLVLSVLEHGKQSGTAQHLPTDTKLVHINVDPNDIKTVSGVSTKEIITAHIGKLGENISFSKAFLLLSHPDVALIGYCHPNDKIENVQLGQFIAAIGVKRNENNSGFPTEKLAHQICQHIIGMKPESLDTAQKNEPEAPSRELKENQNTEQEQGEEEEEDELNAFSKVDTVSIDENENRLLRQAFMLNPRQTVSDYLAVHGAKITDFHRFELGKTE